MLFWFLFVFLFEAFKACCIDGSLNNFLFNSVIKPFEPIEVCNKGIKYYKRKIYEKQMSEKQLKVDFFKN